MTAALIALGSNIGESRSLLVTAIHELNELPDTRVQAVSRLYSTAPVGFENQPDFLNAAALIETQLPPADLLAALHHIEIVHGRTREIHWGPRTLDLDLIDYAGIVSAKPELLIPHPRAAERQFVIWPLVDVAPFWLLNGKPVENLLEESADVQIIDDAMWSGL